MEEKEADRGVSPIDIKEVFRSKNPRMARMIPGFVYRILKNALELDFINEILRKYGHLHDIEFARNSIEMFNVTVDVRGRENLPEKERSIFVSNHPLGGFDGVLLIRELGEKYKDIKFLVNDILMNLKNMDGIFVPINKHGAQAMENVRRIDKIYSSDSQVITFPAGLVSRRRRGKIEDPVWQKSFITKAVKYQRDVVPIHITGRCRNIFYNFANLRKFLGIKANLEMFLLPKETFKHSNTHYIITIGKPVSWEIFDKRYKAIEWAQKVKKHCYGLPEDRMREFKVD